MGALGFGSVGRWGRGRQQEVLEGGGRRWRLDKAWGFWGICALRGVWQVFKSATAVTAVPGTSEPTVKPKP